MCGHYGGVLLLARLLLLFELQLNHYETCSDAVSIFQAHVITVAGSTDAAAAAATTTAAAAAASAAARRCRCCFV
jgi:hypothetical protein